MRPQPGDPGPDPQTLSVWTGGNEGDPWLASYQEGWYNTGGNSYYYYRTSGKIGRISPSN